MKKEENEIKKEYKTAKDIIKEANEAGVTIEIYTSNDSHIADSLHTDTCDYVGGEHDLLTYSDNQILSHHILEPQTYNDTIYANCGENEEDSIMVVVVEA